MLAKVTRMSAPSGSTSGMVTSWIWNGLPGPKNTAARALSAISPPSGSRLGPEREGVVQGADGELRVLVLDHARHRDLRGGDHLDVDALAREGLEHARGHAGVAPHPHAHDGHLGH